MLPAWAVPIIVALIKVGIQWLEKNNAKAETSKPVDRAVVDDFYRRVREAEDRARRAGGAGEGGA